MPRSRSKKMAKRRIRRTRNRSRRTHVSRSKKTRRKVSRRSMRGGASSSDIQSLCESKSYDMLATKLNEKNTQLQNIENSLSSNEVVCLPTKDTIADAKSIKSVNSPEWGRQMTQMTAAATKIQGLGRRISAKKKLRNKALDKKIKALDKKIKADAKDAKMNRLAYTNQARTGADFSRKRKFSPWRKKK